MRLQHVVAFRLSVLKGAVMGLWAVLFYFAITGVISERTDDSLRNYAETIMTKYLSGEPLPEAYNDAGSRFYTIHEVPEDYAERHSHIRYKDREVYIKATNRYEPARTVTYIFRTDDGRFMEVAAFTLSISKDSLKTSIFYWLVFLYAGMLAAVVAVNIWTVRRSMRPLDILLGWLDSYSIGQKNKPLDNDTNISEFRRLNDAVRRSMERSETVYEHQKMFIANASHEMQTPLAVCQSRLEMLLDGDNLTEEQMGDIIKTMRTLKDLSATNRSLLLLCKIDNGQFSSFVPVSIDRLVTRLLLDFETVYSRRHIRVVSDVGVPFVVNMDASLASVLVANLLKNAFLHNVDGGEVRVTTGSRVLRVENTASGDPLDNGKIFERFWHAAGSKSSTGLGLALVKAVCRLYGMSVRYGFESGRHVFEITACEK